MNTYNVLPGAHYQFVCPTSMGGGSMKSKERRSLIPIAFSESTVYARLVRWISGTAVGSISSR